LLSNKTFMGALLLGILLFTAAGLYAGTGGKIAGVVKSAETGEPLAGATVTVMGTTAATATDLDGEFYLINLPVGDYNVKVELIGYQAEIR
jgi:hypothetical protein